MVALAQIKTDLKREGVLDWITEPDGNISYANERALLSGCRFDVSIAQQIQDFSVNFLTLPREPGERVTEYELESIHRRFPNYDPEAYSVKKPFALLRWWHRRVIAQLYAWRNADGSRRYRRAFVTTAKKSGKTSTLAMLPLYELLVGAVPEKEVYVVATTEDQAAILYKKTHAMLGRSPALKKLLKPRFSSRVLVNSDTESFFKTLPADPDTVQGINPSLLILDELHAWRNREVYDALIYGDIRRVDSLTISITTAGDDIEGIGYEEYEAAKDLLDPDNDRTELDAFAFIAEAGRDPVTGKYSDYEWDSDDAIIQANPSLWENDQPMLKIRQMREAARSAPNKRRNYIRYICNRYVASIAGTWIEQDKWRACINDDIPSHEGDEVWCGLDLATVEDLVALAMVWLGPNGKLDLKVKFWMPEDGIQEKAERWKCPSLHQWVSEGWINTTPGSVIDAATLRWDISGVAFDEKGQQVKRNSEAISSLYKVRTLAFDPYQASNLVIQQLGDYDGMPVAKHGQGYLDLSVPSKEFSNRILQKTLCHDGNPVMRWMVQHCVVDTDPAENIKPNKRKSRHKIDGIVASVMAVGMAAVNANKSSVYESRGVRSF